MTGTDRERDRRPALRLEVEVENRDRLEAFRPCVIVGNHQSFLDVVTFGSIFPRRTVSAGKREIGKIPIFGWFYRLSGNLIVDHSDARQARDSEYYVKLHTVKFPGGAIRGQLGPCHALRK